MCFIGIFIAVCSAIRYALDVAIVGLSVSMSYAVGRGAIRRAREVQWFSPEDIERFSSGMRHAFGAPPLAVTLYAAFLGLDLLAVSIFLLTKSDWFFISISAVAGIMLCAATFVDWFMRLRYVFSFAPVRKSAMWILGFFATTAILFSTVVAKQLTHGIAHVDPASMPEFVNLVTAFVFPFALSAVMSAVLTFLMVSQYVALFIITCAKWTPNGGFTMVLPAGHKRLLGAGHEDLDGKNVPASQPWWNKLIDGLHHILRPMGTGVIAFLVISGGVFVANFAKSIPQGWLQSALVSIEYRRPHLCENILATVPIAYLQGGYVSMATPEGNGYNFSVEKCHK